MGTVNPPKVKGQMFNDRALAALAALARRASGLIQYPNEAYTGLNYIRDVVPELAYQDVNVHGIDFQAHVVISMTNGDVLSINCSTGDTQYVANVTGQSLDPDDLA